MAKKSTFEKVLDIAEENVMLKQALKDTLGIMDEYGNIEILLPIKERLKLQTARKLISQK